MMEGKRKRWGTCESEKEREREKEGEGGTWKK